MHITGILHKNFWTSKPVGHVGSSELKKAETVVFIEKEDNVSIKQNVSTLEICLWRYTLDVNKDWLPYEIDNSKGDKLQITKRLVTLNFNLYLQWWESLNQ
jgi:hypothetical protein